MLGPLMIDLNGSELSQEESELLQHPYVGGVILFTRNYKNREQLQKLISNIRQARDSLLIAVDHEGGRVQRFREEFTRLPAVAELGAQYPENPNFAKEECKKWGFQMAKELLAVGIDFSFAPVLDINHGVSDVIGDRSFHSDPNIVSELAEAYIQGMNRAGMKATGKHFPGHGAVVADSHEQLPIDERESKAIYADMQPFIQLKNKLAAIMPAHIVYKKLDQYPTGFSRFWLQHILREQIQFNGAIISDDLSMKGAEIMGDYPERARAALAAGCDMILVCNCRKGVEDVLENLKYDIKNSVQERLLNMKASF